MPRVVVKPKGNRPQAPGEPLPPSNFVWIGPPAADGEGFASIRCGDLAARISVGTMQRLFSRGRCELIRERHHRRPEEYFWMDDDFGISHIDLKLEHIPVEIAQAAINLFERASNGGRGD